jgi:hypothetical protein
MATLRGLRLVRASGTRTYHPGSPAIIVPLDVDEALGVVAQALFDRDPSGVRNDEQYEAISRAAARAGHPVRYQPPMQGPDGRWWHDGKIVPTPEGK